MAGGLGMGKETNRKLLRASDALGLLCQHHSVTEQSLNALLLLMVSQTPQPPSLSSPVSKMPEHASSCLKCCSSCFPLLKATWPRPLVTCPELNQKVIFLVLIFLIYLGLFIYFLLLFFHFTDVDDSHCRSKDIFSWLLAPNSLAYRLASCRFLLVALFSHPHPSSWPHSSSHLQPCDNSHCLCLLLFPRYSLSSSQNSLLLSFCSHFFFLLVLKHFFFFPSFPWSLLYPCVMQHMPSLQSKTTISSKGMEHESSEPG